ncbi:MAG TPA: monovalent cation:proton antiporter-2 (CPA2) family protein [Microvirga sp.]|jgi:monovalent cation:proton antiporter-2 (CPA2) family protein|nr:monovalent cation:proton antiporter-2 (CPA2) family protein [Microvirga sp.]
MAGAASHASFLPPVLTFCGAAVVAVPVFRLLGLSAVLGYLAAGVAIGPSGFKLIADPGTTATVAELGVVLLLFIVGLELKLSHLWSMRRDIFGLGFAQLALTALVVGALAVASGFSLNGAIVTGLAFGLSATAIGLQLLEERHDMQAPYGKKSFAILLFQDLSIVPILALLPLLAATSGSGESMLETLKAVGIAGAGIVAVVLVGRYGLNPFFGVLAKTGAREVLTASALLVVLGAALLLQEVGLSMAMGAFLAGLLLAESNFRHQLEADIEPFRGILLGLFFMSVGMSIDLSLVQREWLALLTAVPVVVALKILIIAGLVRLFGGSLRDGIRSGAVLSPAGEFAFVLLPLAASLQLLPAEQGQFVTALAAMTMLLGPITAKLLDMALDRVKPAEQGPVPGLPATAEEEFDSRVLVIGFGRFGQIVNQVMLAQRIGVTVIDNNVERIRDAARFGLRVYYGDGTRLDVLRAAGAEKAEVICICVDDPATALRMVELVHADFKQARSFVRAYDRLHAIELMKHEVDYQLRETFESAIVFSRAALEELGVEAAAAATAADDVRKRDIARLVMQTAGGFMGGADLVIGAKVAPQPLVEPAGKARALSSETRHILGEEAA